MKLKIYGSRASVAFFNRESLRYGGNTSCVKVDMDGRIIIIDCGTGIMQFYADTLKEMESRKTEVWPKIDILLSHLHLDHIIGLSMFSPIFDAANDFKIYTISRNERPLDEQIFGVFKPPYWPVDLTKLNKAKLIEINNRDTFSLNAGINVTPFESEHSDGTVAFRIDGEKTLVYLLDYEINKNAAKLNALADYCNNADVIIFDSTYLPSEYPKKLGWGHSTYESGVMLAEKSSCKRMIFSHFSQNYTDETFDSLSIDGLNEKYFLAFDGMEMEL